MKSVDLVSTGVRIPPCPQNRFAVTSNNQFPISREILNRVSEFVWSLEIGVWNLFAKQAVVAQLVEHLHGKEKVTSPILVNGSEKVIYG